MKVKAEPATEKTAPPTGAGLPDHNPLFTARITGFTMAAIFTILAATAQTVAASPEPSLGDHGIDRLVLSADAVVEGEVVSGGTFDALFHVTAIYAGICPEYIELFNTNKHPWNTRYHAWRAGDKYILLLAGSGARYTLLQPGVGAYRLYDGKVITSISEPPLRYPVDEKDFRSALLALCDLYSGKQVDPDTIARLHEMLGGTTASQRHFAAEMSGKLFDVSSEEILIVASNSRNPKLRQAAVASLGRLPGKDITRLLADKLRDPSPTVAYNAATALVRRGDVEFTEELMDWFRKELEAAAGLNPDHYRRERLDRFQAILWPHLYRNSGNGIAGPMFFLSGLRLPDAAGRQLAENAYTLIGFSGDESLIGPLAERLRKQEGEAASADDFSTAYAIEHSKILCAAALARLALTDEAGSYGEFMEWWEKHKTLDRRQRARLLLVKAREKLVPGIFSTENPFLLEALFAVPPEMLFLELGDLLRTAPALQDPRLYAATGSPLALPFIVEAALDDSVNRRLHAVEAMRLLCRRRPSLAPAFSDILHVLLLDGSSSIRSAARDACIEIAVPGAAGVLARDWSVCDYYDKPEVEKVMVALTSRTWGDYENAMTRESERARLAAFHWGISHPEYSSAEARITARWKRVFRQKPAGSPERLSNSGLFFMLLDNKASAAARAEWRRRIENGEIEVLALEAVRAGIRRDEPAMVKEPFSALFLRQENPAARACLLWATGRRAEKPPIDAHGGQDGEDDALSGILAKTEDPLWLWAAGAWLLSLPAEEYNADSTGTRRFADNVLMRLSGGEEPDDSAWCAVAARLRPEANLGGGRDKTSRTITLHPFRQRLFEAVKSGEDDARSRAGCRLAALYPGIVPESEWFDLLKALDYNNYVPVARSASRYGGIELAEKCAGECANEEARIRRVAVFTLSVNRAAKLSSEAFRRLAEALGDESSVTRWYAAHAAAKRDFHELPKEIRKVLLEKSIYGISDFDETLAELMMEISAKADASTSTEKLTSTGSIILSRFRSLSRPGPAAYRALGTLPEASVGKTLIGMYDKNSWREQYYSMQGFSSRPAADYDARLLKSYRDETGQMESLAADAIARRGDDAVRLLEPLLKSEHFSTRLRAVRTLGRTASSVAKDYLVKRLKKLAFEKEMDAKSGAETAAVALALAELCDCNEILPIYGKYDAGKILERWNSLSELRREALLPPER